MEDLRKCNSTHSCVGHRNAFPSLHEDGLLLSSAHLAAQAVLEAFMRLHGTPGSGTTKLGHHHAYQGNLQDVLVNTYSAQSVCICSGLMVKIGRVCSHKPPSRDREAGAPAPSHAHRNVSTGNTFRRRLKLKQAPD